MKKILLLVAFFAIVLTPCLAQVVSVTMKSAVSLIDSAKITHFDSVTNQTDTFYTRQKTADEPTFTTPFFSPYVKRIGSGEYVDVLTSPLVSAGDTTFVITEISNDSLFTSAISSVPRMVVPKYKVVLPTIYAIHKNPTTVGIVVTLPFTLGNADSVKITRKAARDSLYVFSAGNKTWIKKQNGTLVDTIQGLGSDKDYYVTYIVENIAGNDVEKFSFTTLPTSRKPWIAKQADSSKNSASSFTFSGRAISYGLTGTVFAKYGKNGILSQTSSSVPLTGVGEEVYTINLNGLDQNTDYTIRVYAQNSLGTDSFDFVTRTDGQNGKTFTITTLSANGDLGFVRMNGSYTIPNGYTGTISCGVFTDNTGTVTVENATETNTYTGNGTLYNEFRVSPGTYWVAYWGNCSDGQFVLLSQLIQVTVPFVATGITEREKISLSVYPNPTTDYVNINTESFTGENIEIYDHVGKLVLMHSVSETQTSIDVRDLVSGIYILKIKNHSSKFIKE